MAITRIRNNQVYNNDINAQYKLQTYSITGGLLANNFTYTGNMTIGNLTVNGVTTTVDTTNLVIADPLLAINRNQSGTPTYDLGVVMGRGNQNNVALIWEEGAQQFQLQYTTESTAATTFGTINNSGFANLQAYGIALNNATITTTNITNIVSGNVAITGGTINNTTIGAVTPNSGVFTSITTSAGGQIKAYFNGPIGANGGNTGAFTTVSANQIGNTGTQLYVGNIWDLGNAVIQGGLALNSNATITTDQTTASLYNTTATTINAYGAATLINYGSTSGAINFVNPNIYSSATTLSAFNTTPTTITFGNAATSLRIGATTGTTTIFNTVATPTLNAGTIGNSGAVFTGATSTLTGASQAASFTTSGGGQLTGYLTGAIGANAANSAVFTIVTVNPTIGIPSGYGQIYANNFAGNISAYVIADNTFVHFGSATNTQLNWKVNGQTPAYITTNGSVVVSGLTSLNTSGYGNVYVTNYAGNNTAYIIADNNFVHIGSATNTPLNFKMNKTTPMFIDTTGNIVVATSTSATSQTTGALVVTGGVGVGGAVYASSFNAPTINTGTINAGTIGNSGSSIYGSNIAITGNALIQNGLALNSNATLTTDQTTASLFNTTATTVNLGGAATAINMGASAPGTVKINSTGNSYGSGQGALQIGGGFYAAGDSWIQGNLVVNYLNSIGYTAVEANAPLLYLAANSVTNYNYEIGFYSHKYDAIAGYNHTGLVRYHTDNAWYLFSNIRTEPTTIVDLGNANIIYDTLKLGNMIAYSGNTSTSTTTGALVVYGGAGINGNIYAYAIQNTPIGNGTASTGAFTTLTASTVSTTGSITSGNQVVGYLNGALGANSPNSVVATSVTTTNGGQVIGYLTGAIGANTANSATFTTANVNGTLYTATVQGATIGNSGAVFSGASLTLTGNASVNALAAGQIGNTTTILEGTIGSATPSQPNITSVGTLTTLTVSGAINGNTFNGVAVYAGTIGNTGAVFTGSTSTLTGSSVAGSFTTSSGGQVSGYLTGAIGANTANSGTFTTANVNGALYAASVSASSIGNAGAAFTGASMTLTGNSIAANYNSSGTITINNVIGNGGATSTSTTTGAIIVTGSGGIGVGGNIYSGANISATTAVLAPTMYNSNIYPIAGTDLYKNVGQNGNLWINYLGYVANLVVNGNTAAGYGNVLTTNGATGQVGVRVGPGAMIANVGFQVNTTDAMIVPTGAQSQRPSNPQQGMIRFNTNNNQIEYYSGTTWTGTGSIFTVVSAQQFFGDGTTTIFTLSQSASTAATVVAINGVVQIPTTAYSVSGTTLTFTEAPLSTDVIDARVIATTSTVNSVTDTLGANTFVANTNGIFATVNNTVQLQGNTNGNFIGTRGISTLNPNVSLSAGVPTVIDSFNTNVYRGAKYVISVSDYTNYNFQMSEAIVVIGNANATVQNYGIVTANGTSITTFYANVSGTTASLYANAGVSSYAKVQQIYMPL